MAQCAGSPRTLSISGTSMPAFHLEHLVWCVPVNQQLHVEAVVGAVSQPDTGCALQQLLLLVLMFLGLHAHQRVHVCIVKLSGRSENVSLPAKVSFPHPSNSCHTSFA